MAPLVKYFRGLSVGYGFEPADCFGGSPISIFAVKNTKKNGLKGLNSVQLGLNSFTKKCSSTLPLLLPDDPKSTLLLGRV